MSEHQTHFQSPLGRVRGHGSAKSGTHHWWMQRVTSLAMLPLMIWFAFSIASKAGAPWEVVAEWIGRPFNAVLLVAMIALGFYHTASGLQVVVEDYIRPERSVMLANLAIRSVCVLLGLLAALSVLRLAI
ncbi:succinate dehydrogenase, hydrophobic membrane anchor protein [Roseomonas xinghualingensis]|uniref:succinate dehydrogenase, hydrophobic membrane anchor protein n=1 Tax=Roseomonas xinghualingensis TaxID=2986475 RepID=UPI0021F11BBF|nr:succinate dehydrogenase, hydrophobic membrane anchor protein [Roseomonas sp. SXEYE001]MCV4206459.1 succinate dehydrogenase, hydrophobic membrane anchor protein [Roseomonas sp. SXEYE001]